MSSFTPLEKMYRFNSAGEMFSNNFRKQGFLTGFTLIETILVIGLLSLITVAIAPYFKTTVESWQAYDRELELVQIGRVALGEMADALKMATAFDTIDTGQIAFSDAGGDDVEFRLSGGALQKSTSGYGWQDLAPSVDSIAFTYYDSDGEVTGDTGSVRCVNIALTVSDAESEAADMLFSTRVMVRRDFDTEYSLAINEINYNPAGGSFEAAREWVEVYNFGSSDVDVSGWTIEDDNQQDNISGYMHGSTIITSGGYGVIAAGFNLVFLLYDVDSEATRLVTDDLAIGNKLSNNGETITIRDASGTIVDSVAYDDDWGGDGNGDTLERIDHTGSPSEESNWEGSSVHDSYTPGEANSISGSTPVIRRRFR